MLYSITITYTHSPVFIYWEFSYMYWKLTELKGDFQYGTESSVNSAGSVNSV